MTTATVQTFRLPDVGEGLTEAEIIAWHVRVGDTVGVNQVLVEIETAKSAVELPSPYAGEVVELFASEGHTVDVGSPIIAIRTAAATAETEEQEPKLLVGYGAKASGSRRRRLPTTGPAGNKPASNKPRAKPPVRKLAKTLGVDLALVEASGPDGTVVRADVIRASETLCLYLRLRPRPRLHPAAPRSGSR